MQGCSEINAFQPIICKELSLKFEISSSYTQGAEGYWAALGG